MCVTCISCFVTWYMLCAYVLYHVIIIILKTGIQLGVRGRDQIEDFTWTRKTQKQKQKQNAHINDELKWMPRSCRTRSFRLLSHSISTPTVLFCPVLLCSVVFCVVVVWCPSSVVRTGYSMYLKLLFLYAGKHWVSLNQTYKISNTNTKQNTT